MLNSRSASGYYVEIDYENPDTDETATHTPALEGDVRWQPQLNDLPTLELPVTRDAKWRRPGFDDATVRAWHDGDRLPIDTLDRVRDDGGQTVLECSGGRPLRDVQTREIEQGTPIHEAATDVVQAAGLTANVDAPDPDENEHVLLGQYDTTAAFEERLVDELSDTTPLSVSDGSIDHTQIGWFWEGEDYDSSDLVELERTGSEYSNGEAVWTDGPSDEAFVWELTPDHTIPAEHVRLVVRHDIVEDDISAEISWRWELNGETVQEIDNSTTATPGPSWEGFAPDAYPDDGPDLEAGETYDLEWVYRGGDSGREYRIDCVVVADDRYWDGEFAWQDWDDSTDSNETLADPPLYDSERVRLRSSPQARSITGARASLTIDDTSGDQSIALSNDRGQTYDTDSNTDQYDTDFDDPGNVIDLKLTLSGYGSRSNQTPRENYKGQSIESISLEADLAAIPTVRDSSQYERRGVDILSDLADRADALWEVGHDGDGLTVEWARPGERTSDTDPDLVDYRVSRQSGPEDVYQAAIVNGSAQRANDERFTADFGSWHELSHDRLIEGREAVVDPETGEQFERESDYEMGNSDGRIKPLDSGLMEDGTEYRISYWRETRGEYALDDVDDPNTRVIQLKGLTSDQACKQAAWLFVDRVSEPYYTAEVTLPRDSPSLSLVSAIDPSQLPTDGTPLSVRSIDHSRDAITIQLGERESVGEVIADLRSSIGAVERRV